MPWRPPADEPLPDLRDAEEREAVRKIIAVLPADHPAHDAHRRGVDTITMTHIVPHDRMDLVRELIDVYFAAQGRVWARSGHFSPQSSRASS